MFLCEKCNLPLTWIAELNSSGDDLRIFVKYESENGPRCMVVEDGRLTHKLETPNSLQTLKVFADWLDREIQRGDFDRK
jgi:hypothetical protein